MLQELWREGCPDFVTQLVSRLGWRANCEFETWIVLKFAKFVNMLTCLFPTLACACKVRELCVYPFSCQLTPCLPLKNL